MLRKETWSFTDGDVSSDAGGMKNLAKNDSKLRRRVNSVGPGLIDVPNARLVRPGMPSHAAGARSVGRRLVAELQPRGPATHPRLALWKLRLSFAPAESVITASAANYQL